MPFEWLAWNILLKKTPESVCIIFQIYLMVSEYLKYSEVPREKSL